MQTQGKFILFNIDEFRQFLISAVVSRSVSHVQDHHTWSPSYRNFNGSNHFEKLKSMEASHIQRGFEEIGQHITTFPDGTIAICRNMDKDPACIKGANHGGLCIENLGNFDKGQDQMTPEQRETIIQVNALLCFKFNLKPSLSTIVYHHWFQLTNGFRDGGQNDDNHKTCPGTGFFGGNTENDFTANLLPLIIQELAQVGNTVDKVTATVKIGIVHTPSLNVRTGPDTSFPAIDRLLENEKVTILESNGEWDRIGQNRWVNSNFVALQ